MYWNSTWLACWDGVSSGKGVILDATSILHKATPGIEAMEKELGGSGTWRTFTMRSLKSGFGSLEDTDLELDAELEPRPEESNEVSFVHNARDVFRCESIKDA